MTLANLMGTVTLDLEKEPLMVWERGRVRGRSCVGVYASLLERGYVFPQGNVFLRNEIPHLTGFVGGMNIFEFGQHHRALAHRMAKIPFQARVWDGPGRQSDGGPWNPEYYPLTEMKLTQGQCPCGGYSFWDHVKERDAREIAEQLGLSLRFGQQFLDS